MIDVDGVTDQESDLIAWQAELLSYDIRKSNEFRERRQHQLIRGDVAVQRAVNLVCEEVWKAADEYFPVVRTGMFFEPRSGLGTWFNEKPFNDPVRCGTDGPGWGNSRATRRLLLPAIRQSFDPEPPVDTRTPTQRWLDELANAPPDFARLHRKATRKARRLLDKRVSRRLPWFDAFRRQWHELCQRYHRDLAPFYLIRNSKLISLDRLNDDDIEECGPDETNEEPFGDKYNPVPTLNTGGGFGTSERLDSPDDPDQGSLAFITLYQTRRQEVIDVISGLRKERTRLVALLRLFRGLSEPQIGVVLGIKRPNGVNEMVCGIRQAFRSCDLPAPRHHRMVSIDVPVELLPSEVFEPRNALLRYCLTGDVDPSFKVHPANLIEAEIDRRKSARNRPSRHKGGRG